ncbi:MAG: hypothetical protein MUF31_18235 [Akkermansiaceae bacterium]|jgi:hypothetical protein|nr:hypothetical protein [Akkermansiaceae bacterium]
MNAMTLLRILAVLLSLGLAACTHTAIAPLSDPQGRVVVLEAPGARVGKTISQDAMNRMIGKLTGSFESRAWPLKYFPSFDLSKDAAEVTVLGGFGDMETKSGRPFVGAFPIVALRSNRPAEETENALRMVVTDVYRNARKSGLRVIPASDLKDKSKPQTP